MMIEFVILTFSLTVVAAPMVERLMDVLSAIWLAAPMMLSPPTFEKTAGPSVKWPSTSQVDTVVHDSASVD